ncbi:RNA polymerase sigma factor [Georgenia ruanii]|nr:sigma-70 family RNA polymerase sigma factor [Georgenia ruanii]
MSDAEKFTRLYREHRAELERFVRRRLPPPQVEDVIAEAFLVAWRRLDAAPAELRPWLFGIARNLMLTAARTHGRWHALHVRLAAEPEPADLELAADVASRTDLVRAWGMLTPGEREVLTLVAWDGLTAREAATVLGCEAGTFRVRLLRARRHLLRILDRLPQIDAWPERPLTEEGARQ